MLEQLNKVDTDIFLYLNGLHSPFFDFIMFWVSSATIWIPLYLFFIFIIYRTYPKKWWVYIIGLIIAVGLADLASVNLFKNVFQRLRPCHDPDISNLVHIVRDHCGGKYSFVSSHAANMFSIATFMSLALFKKYKYAWTLLFFWASLIGYSRIYLGVHYPGDIIGGAALGASVAGVFYYLTTRTARIKE